MKEDCDQIRPLLDAWIDGELSNSAERRVARHADGCPDCRKEAESRRGIDAAISADDKAGDPGDAYFSTLGDRISARFDFPEAARRWVKPERPSRRHWLEIPRAWVPRFAFGIAGVAVATIAGLLVRGLGEHPILAPLPRVTDTVMELREPQTPGSSVDHLAPARDPASVRAVPDFAAQPKRRAAESPAPETAKRPARKGSDHPAAPQSDAVSARTRSTEKTSGADAAAGSSSFLAPQEEDADDKDSVADAMTPGRPELLAFFGALTETGEERATGSSTEALSAPSHMGLQARGEASMLADSAWIRLRRDEARALADSALAAGTLEDCESALRAYWTMLHRDGRSLLPAPATRAKALAADRLRIERLLRCASR